MKSREAASLGAAILAGVAVGSFESVESAADSMVEVKERISPSRENIKEYGAGYAMYKKLFLDLTECFDRTK